jgi:hypothetical protein
MAIGDTTPSAVDCRFPANIPPGNLPHMQKGLGCILGDGVRHRQRMEVNMRRRTTVVGIALLSLLVCLTARSARAETSYVVSLTGDGPDGSWIGTGAITSPPFMAGAQFPFMDTYTRSLYGRSGAVLCQMPPVQIEYAGQKLTVSALGQGTWIRVAKNHYKFTVARLVMNEAGQPALLAKFNADFELVDPNALAGTVTVGFYDWNQNLLLTMEGTLSANRIAVQE